MRKLLIITGPTATGKTALGLELAKDLAGEIISADSRQVYKFLDIATGKDTAHFQWGIDLVTPDKQFNVSDWVNYATKTIEDIWARNKLPIVVGGTGQYIKELLYPSETLHIPPNRELRTKNYELKDLQKMLQETDPQRWAAMNGSDRGNPRRLIRAIETAGKKPEVAKRDFDFLIIGLTAPGEILEKRIDERVNERVRMGALEERKRVEKFRPKAFGYIEKDTDEWKRHEENYARRQLRYLKKYLPEIQWVDVSRPGFKQKIRALLGAW